MTSRHRLVMRETDRILIGLTSLALNAPSTYTIAWSKQQHPEELPILYAGVATSALTVGGAILGDKHHGDKIMIFGLVTTIALFGYVTFIYKPPTAVALLPPSPRSGGRYSVGVAVPATSAVVR